MHCYCFKILVQRGTDVRNIKFDEFIDATTNEADSTLYCNEWLINYGLQQGAIIGTSLVVVFINIVASTILTISVGIEKSHTVNDETMG